MYTSISFVKCKCMDKTKDMYTFCKKLEAVQTHVSGYSDILVKLRSVILKLLDFIVVVTVWAVLLVRTVGNCEY